MEPLRPAICNPNNLDSKHEREQITREKSMPLPLPSTLDKEQPEPDTQNPSGRQIRSLQILSSMSCPINLRKTVEQTLTIPQLQEELRKIYFNYFNPRLSASMIRHARRLSLLLSENGKIGGLTDRDNFHALPYPFKVVDAANTNNIRQIDIQQESEKISVALPKILSGLLTDSNYQWQMQMNRVIHAQIVLITVRCILEECNLVSKTLKDLLTTLQAKFAPLIEILRKEYAVPVDDGVNFINIYDKFVDHESETLFLKTVALARVNYEQVMYALRQSDTEVEIVLRDGQKISLDFNDTGKIYDNSINLYKRLVDLLRLPCKYTRESLEGILEDLCERLQLSGKSIQAKKEELKNQLKSIWPVGDDTNISELDQLSLLAFVERLLKIARNNLLFFKRTIFLDKCLLESSSKRLYALLFTESGKVRPEVQELFVPFSQSEQEELAKYIDNRSSKLMGPIQAVVRNNDVFVERNRHETKKFIRNIL